ncbi:right-handed parallel beta-helix repeat-containing protein, partial [Aquirufa aurantiipilula]
RNAAQTAETGAVAAKNSAETASSAAVTAKIAAQTAETGAVTAKTDAQNLVAGALIGTPKAVYASLSALNTANPDHAFIYVTTDNGHWNYWNGSAFASGGTYQAPLSVVQETGTSTSNVMSQKTVSDIIGNNYSSKYTVLNRFIWASTGVDTANADYDSTDFIPCSPNDTVSLRLPDNSVAGYAFYDSGNMYISGGTGDGLANAKSYITPPAGTSFLRVCKLKVDTAFLTIFSINSLYNQVKEVFPVPVQTTGSNTSDFISQKVVTDIIGDDLSPKYTSTNFYIRASSGTREANADYESTDYLPCTPNDIFIGQLPDNSVAGYAFYDSGNMYISGGTGDGLANAKSYITPPANTAYIRICKLKTDPSFLAKYSAKSNVQALRSIPTPQVDLLNGKAKTFDLASELLSKDIVIVPSGTWNIPTTINIPSGKKIYGVRGKSILQASGGNTKVFNIVSKSDISISGLTIKGEASVVDYADTSKISNKEQALAENGAGTKYGIYIESSRDIIIDDIEVKNFDYCGIYVKTLAQNYMNGITISSGYINNNYIGLKLADGSEYSVYSNLHINTNHIGLVIESANNNVQLSSITRNVFGAVIKPVGYNTGHGSLSNCALNHNTVMALYVSSIDSGYIIVGCNIHYPETNTIYIKNSSGIIISSMNLYGLATVEGGGGNMIISSNFRILASSVTLVGTTHLSLKNNIYVDGSSPNSINN